MKQIDWLAKPALGASLVAAIWGFNIVVMKIALNDMDPLLFTAARFLLLTMVLVPFVKISTAQLKLLLPIALVMGLGHFYVLAGGNFYRSWSHRKRLFSVRGAFFNSIKLLISSRTHYTCASVGHRYSHHRRHITHLIVRPKRSSMGRVSCDIKHLYVGCW